LTNLI